MTKPRLNCVTSLLIATVVISGGRAADRPLRLGPGVENLLVQAKISGNLELLDKGMRGAADHVVYDPRRAEFVKPSQYNEYGVGFGQDLGVAPERQAAWWMAEWAEPIQANLILLTGVYPNQPQPDTAWGRNRKRSNWPVTGRTKWTLAIGNFNETMHTSGMDRQFRGRIRGLEIFGSRISGRGAMSLEEIGKR